MRFSLILAPYIRCEVARLTGHKTACIETKRHPLPIRASTVMENLEKESPDGGSNKKENPPSLTEKSASKTSGCKCMRNSMSKLFNKLMITLYIYLTICFL